MSDYLRNLTTFERARDLLMQRAGGPPLKRLWFPIIASLLIAAPASAAPIVLNNGGFEAGNLSGWSTVGSAVPTPSTSVTTFDGTLWTIAAAGTTMAQLDPSAGIATVEAALGLAAGSLAAVDTTDLPLTDAAAIYQSFTANAGDSLTMFWNYAARDYIPFNDPAFAVLIGPGGTVITELASIYGGGIPVGTSGNSGWQQFQALNLAAGNYTIAFVTTNSGDTILDSALFIDDQAGTAISSAVPEPATLGLLGLGLLFVARKRYAKR